MRWDTLCFAHTSVVAAARTVRAELAAGEALLQDRPIGDRPWHTALRQMRDSHPPTLSLSLRRWTAQRATAISNRTIVSFSFSSLSPVTALSSDSIDDPNPHALSKLGSCRGAPAGFARQPIERAGVPGSALPTALASSCSRCARQDCCSKEAKA